MLRKLLSDHAAVTSIEYGIIAALLALGMTTTVNTLGGHLSDVFSTLASPPSSPPPGNSPHGP